MAVNKTWNLFKRDNENTPWVKFKTTDRQDIVNMFVIDMNEKAGWQRYAVERDTV